MREKVGKVAKTLCFSNDWGSGGSKSRLAKAAGAEPAGQMRDEKLHAAVARSTFRSQNVQNTPLSDHFWKLRCRKSARRCGAKHILKSKCTKTHHCRTTFGSWDVEKVHAVVANVQKHTRLGPLLEVEMSKKCTPLWRKAHFEVKMYKNTPAPEHFWQLRCRKSARRRGAKYISKSKCTKHHMFAPLFGGSDVEKVHAVVARSTFPSQNVQNSTCSRHFWRFRCPFASLHYTTLHYTTLHYLPLHYTTTTNYNYTTTQLHNYTTTQTTQLHSTTLHYTKLHYSTLHYTTLTLHSTTLHYTRLHYLPLHFTTLLYTTLHYNYNYNYTTTLHYTPLHSTTLHYTTFHYTTLHYTTLHYTTFHYTPLH